MSPQPITQEVWSKSCMVRLLDGFARRETEFYERGIPRLDAALRRAMPAPVDGVSGRKTVAPLMVYLVRISLPARVMRN